MWPFDLNEEKARRASGMKNPFGLSCLDDLLSGRMGQPPLDEASPQDHASGQSIPRGLVIRLAEDGLHLIRGSMDEVLPWESITDLSKDYFILYGCVRCDFSCRVENALLGFPHLAQSPLDYQSLENAVAMGVPLPDEVLRALQNIVAKMQALLSKIDGYAVEIRGYSLYPNLCR